ncbi:hypothetical protein H8B06_11970 [Sphingobacterium sp. DN00404]|uniref:Alginate export domain-containing protein n=1 Tax=Sphingobacterium micropteri TaxID=2763501 RepID=A0ABR7YQD8_9SPHI|nr:hypothetical protein [Sphingobacterium micropteri]MBD1433548.1 hypothetical protein [Sphingobacterium micropteri]
MELSKTTTKKLKKLSIFIILNLLYTYSVANNIEKIREEFFFDIKNSKIELKSDSSNKKNATLDISDLENLRKYTLLDKKHNEHQPAGDTIFKPSIQVGALLHMFAYAQQDGYSAPQTATEPTAWGKGFSLYRARVLVGGQLSKKGSFFIETDLPSIIGSRNADGTKNVKVSQIILDAQYQHEFTNAFQLVVGKQLVSNNRNGLQSAASLLTNDFSYFQYPYNMFEDSPLQGNFGRDLGVNARGFLFKDKFEYRLGVFTGRIVDDKDPLRYVGRVAYNFLDKDKDYYYAGTNLGQRKLLTWGLGYDTQSSYHNYSSDLFLDYPVSSDGSLTFSAAFQYMSGGTSTEKYSFATLIPKQTVQFLELGYYFKNARLQPWVKYENNQVKAESIQAGAMDIDRFDKLNSGSVFGGGLNYFFNDFGTNLRLSYTTRSYNVENTATAKFDKQTYGQCWLQLQFFIF